MAVEVKQGLRLHGVARRHPDGGEMPDDGVVLGGSFIEETQCFLTIALAFVELTVAEQ